jgi:hypothetical protein
MARFHWGYMQNITLAQTTKGNKKFLSLKTTNEIYFVK